MAATKTRPCALLAELCWTTSRTCSSTSTPFSRTQTYSRYHKAPHTSSFVASQTRQASSTSQSLHHKSSSRALSTTPHRYAVSTPRAKVDLRNKDRGPTSSEDTQTDFSVLNVLGSTANPSTSVDSCAFDGFALDSGLSIGDGDGVLLVGSEAFVWRPWMGFQGTGQGSQAVASGRRGGDGIVNGSAMRDGATDTERSGGVFNKMGQFEIPEQAWGMFSLLWPKPDLLIIGTGPQIRPLAPATRSYLQGLGLRLEVLDTRNAAAQFNLLATERGVHEVAGALLPIGFALPKNNRVVNATLGMDKERS